MRIRQVAPFVCVVGLLPALYLVFRGTHEPVGLIDDESWRPTPREIEAAVGMGGAGTFKDRRHDTFANMFKRRYRNRDYTVGVKFDSETNLRLMFAPLIARWDMAAVSVISAAEAQRLFGKHYDVDVYETYVAAPMRKVAEVRYVANRYSVVFDPRFATERPPNRRPTLQPAARLEKSSISHDTARDNPPNQSNSVAGALADGRGRIPSN